MLAATVWSQKVCLSIACYGSACVQRFISIHLLLHYISTCILGEFNINSNEQNYRGGGGSGGGQAMRWCDGAGLNFQCRGLLLIWIIVGQGPIAFAVGAGGDCLDIFSLVCHFSLLHPSL